MNIPTKYQEMFFPHLPNLLIPLGFLFYFFSSFLLHKFFKFRNRKSRSKSIHEPTKNEDSEFRTKEISEKEGGLVISEKEEDLVAEILLGGEALLFLPSKTFQNNPAHVPDDEDPHQDRSEEVMIEVVDRIQTCTFSGSEDGDQESDTWNSPILEIEDDQGPEDEDQDSDWNSPLLEFDNYNHIVCTPENSSNYKSIDNDGKSDADREFETLDSLLLEASILPEKKPQESFVGESTSKSSCEWRSSMRSSTNYRDSELEDLYSSSSRRSSTGWEFDSTFRKYDEEMVLYDRISAEKLHETAVEVLSRSFSQRITSRLWTRNKKSSDKSENPYQELENAYIAQICSTWEALNWNYTSVRRRNSFSEEEYPGYSGQQAQQFQQFQVLLQRFIENEPFEHGRRAEVYARMRMATPKLLQVPQLRDPEGVPSDKSTDPTMVSSSKFLEIIENAIRTFLEFLKADKENKTGRILRYFRPNHRNSVDPSLLLTIKKTTEKKKKKLNDLRRSRRCCLSKKKWKKPEEIEIVMGLIDLKIVSRILRIAEITEEQLHWCEEKVKKVRIWDGKIHRDSSTVFFPAH